MEYLSVGRRLLPGDLTEKQTWVPFWARCFRGSGKGGGRGGGREGGQGACSGHFGFSRSTLFFVLLAVAHTNFPREWKKEWQGRRGGGAGLAGQISAKGAGTCGMDLRAPTFKIFRCGLHSVVPASCESNTAPLGG